MSEFNRRQFHAFLSHAHADKTIVDRIYEWFRDKADINIWYDGANLPAGTKIATHLAESISQCRAAIIVLSKAALNSGWVNEEYERAVEERAKFKGFYRIIPVRIEDCEVPGFLRTTKWVDICNSELGLDAAYNLLTGLYYNEVQAGISRAKDIYISRTWRSSEAALANRICKHLIRSGFRLIGDSPDQTHFNEEERITSIISSTGALVAILPDRGSGKTSPYMLKEIQIAQSLRLPCIVIAEPTVTLPEVLEEFSVRMSTAPDTADASELELQTVVEMLDELWVQPAQPRYIFLGTDFNNEHKQRNQLVKDMIQRVSNMPCIMGDDIREGQVQDEIVKRVSRAYVMLADISEDNLNTCIEAGIARGANTRCHLIAREPRRKPPFMFRDQQVHYYANDFELLGVVHRLIYPYRQRVLNYELS